MSNGFGPKTVTPFLDQRFSIPGHQRNLVAVVRFYWMGVFMRKSIIAALTPVPALMLLAFLLLPSSVHAQGFPPIGGGGTCTGMINEEGFQGQQSAVNNGLYLCSGGVWVEQPLILGTTASACSATWAGGIRYNSGGGAMEFCNGTSWGGIGGASTSIDGLSDGKTDYATDFNLFMGQNAGAAIAAGGQNNLAIGQDALDINTTGDITLRLAGTRWVLP